MGRAEMVDKDDQLVRDDEESSTPDSGDGPWAKTSSGDADSITEDDDGSD
jgi:hypothetical protein